MGRRRGWSILEVVVILAVVGVIAPVAHRTGDARGHFAEAYANGVRAARSLALTSAQPVSFEERPCGASTVLGAHLRAGARVAYFPLRGLMFTPDGLPRTCDGGGVGNTTILLEHRGRQAAVIVSSLGRVRWELR